MFKRKFGAIWLGYILLLVFLVYRQAGKFSTIQSTSTSTTILPTTSASTNSPIPGMTTRYLTLDGRQRSYILNIPPTYNPSQASAVVFILHGGLGSVQGMLDITGFNAQSDRSGFIAVYPNGSGRLDDQFLTWNGGQCCGYAQQ